MEYMDVCGTYQSLGISHDPEEDRHGSKVIIKVLHWRTKSSTFFFSASNQYWGCSADL